MSYLPFFLKETRNFISQSESMSEVSQTDYKDSIIYEKKKKKNFGRVKGDPGQGDKKCMKEETTFSLLSVFG